MNEGRIAELVRELLVELGEDPERVLVLEEQHRVVEHLEQVEVELEQVGGQRRGQDLLDFAEDPLAEDSQRPVERLGDALRPADPRADLVVEPDSVSGPEEDPRAEAALARHGILEARNART